MSSAADIKDDGEQKLQHAKKEISSSRKECTSCEQNNVNDITEGITSIAVLDDLPTCASCGKEGKDSDMNTCNKCKMVKYCNAACKKKHRSKHKKACQKRVAELHEEALFKDHPPLDDCPICFIPMLPSRTDPVSQFQPCCGKIICRGCNYKSYSTHELNCFHSLFNGTNLYPSRCHGLGSVVSSHLVDL